ncbi:MAG: c-type cytochrome [Candidatus Eiseniibacteriota bacterium]
MRSQRWVAAIVVAGAVGVAGLVGCGGGGNQGGESSTSSTSETTTPAPAPDTSAAPAGATGEVSLAVGQKIVAEKCVLCHGTSGKGDGPGGAALNPKPRNWTDHSYMGSQTDDQLFTVIHDGKGSMPAWGKTGILSDSEIRSAIMAVRTFDTEYKGAN